MKAHQLVLGVMYDIRGLIVGVVQPVLSEHLKVAGFLYTDLLATPKVLLAFGSCQACTNQTRTLAVADGCVTSNDFIRDQRSLQLCEFMTAV